MRDVTGILLDIVNDIPPNLTRWRTPTGKTALSGFPRLTWWINSIIYMPFPNPPKYWHLWNSGRLVGEWATPPQEKHLHYTCSLGRNRQDKGQDRTVARLLCWDLLKGVAWLALRCSGILGVPSKHAVNEWLLLCLLISVASHTYLFIFCETGRLAGQAGLHVYSSGISNRLAVCCLFKQKADLSLLLPA